MDPLVEMFDKLSTVGNFFLLVLTIFSVLGFKKWGWPVLAKAGKATCGFFRGIASLSDLPDCIPMLQKMSQMEIVLQRVLGEVMPNGGSSLRDAVTTTLATAKRTELALTIFINSTRAQWDGMGMFAVFEADAEGNNIYANTTYRKWTNRSGAEISGTGWINAIAFDDRAKVRIEWDSCIKDSREFVMNYRMQDAGGNKFCVTCTASPVREPVSGPVVKWVGVIRRLTAGEEC